MMSEVDIGNLPKKEFRMVITMVNKKFRRRMDAQNKKLEVFKRVRKYKEQPNRGEEYNNRN